MKLAAIAKLIKADGYCKLYKVFYDDCRTYDLYIGTKTAIFPLTGFPKAQNESECNEQARKGSKGCTKECKLYELQEPGMTCRDSVLLHAEEAKKILKIRSHNS